MPVVEKYISLEGVDLADLAGLNENHIELIRENFKSRITLRGEKLYIKGDDAEAGKIEKIFKELIFLQNRQGKIKQSDVTLILDLVSEAGESAIRTEELDDVILATKSNVVKPKTPGQRDFYNKTKTSEIVFVIGPAGTGKTYLSVAAALSALLKNSVNKIVLSRPAVEAGESLGFLPGDISEKVNPYLRPLLDALEDMLPFDRLKSYFDKDIIEIVPLAYMRGRTLNNAFLILDEAQNSTAMQMKMFLTRLGINSRAIITGDITQIDLPFKATSGLVQVRDILRGVDGIEFIYLEKKDVVRHRLVKNIIDAYEKFSDGGEK